MGSLADLRNKYEGERVFMIGNGPSLADTPLKLLEDEYTFAMNKINKIYSETSWRPSFYIMSWSPKKIENERNASDDRYVEENIDLGIPCFITSDCADIYGEHGNVYYFDKHSLTVNEDNWLNRATLEDAGRADIETLERVWMDDVEQGVYIYHIMYAATQMAVYMGFDELYFVGCDLGYDYQDPHMRYQVGLDPHQFLQEGSKREYITTAIKRGVFFESIVNGLLFKLINLSSPFVNSVLLSLLDYSDSDHFSSEYMLRIVDRRKIGDDIRKSHTVIKRLCSKRGVRTFNATVGGELELYPRVDISDVVELT